jgi:hypothetical protein
MIIKVPIYLDVDLKMKPGEVSDFSRAVSKAIYDHFVSSFGTNLTLKDPVLIKNGSIRVKVMSPAEVRKVVLSPKIPNSGLK